MPSETTKKTNSIRQRVLEVLKVKDRISREEFVDAPLQSKERRKQMKDLNSVFQSLVHEGYLYTVDRGGDYTFFRHHGRAFPKMWNRRKTPE